MENNWDEDFQQEVATGTFHMSCEDHLSFNPHGSLFLAPAGEMLLSHLKQLRSTASSRSSNEINLSFSFSQNKAAAKSSPVFPVLSFCSPSKNWSCVFTISVMVSVLFSVPHADLSFGLQFCVPSYLWDLQMWWPNANSTCPKQTSPRVPYFSHCPHFPNFPHLKYKHHSYSPIFLNINNSCLLLIVIADLNWTLPVCLTLLAS